jgi:hypothetical protein
LWASTPVGFRNLLDRGDIYVQVSAASVSATIMAASDQLVFADLRIDAESLRDKSRKSKDGRLAIHTRWQAVAGQTSLQLVEHATAAMNMCLTSCRARGSLKLKKTSVKKESITKTLRAASRDFQDLGERLQDRQITPSSKRRGASWATTAASQVKIALEFASGTMSKRSLAKTFDMEKTCVTRSVAQVASFSITSDILRLRELENWIRISCPILDFGFLSLAEDSTKQSFAVKLPGCKHSNSTKPSKVLLMLAMLSWREKGGTIRVWHVEIPPTECPTDDAETMWRFPE